MNKKISQRVHYMVELALMSAIIIAMAFTPLGYIRTPGLAITLLTIPVAIGAILLGPKGGAICGAVFGLTSFVQCFGMSAFSTMLFQINPLGTLFTAVVPRILEGLLCGLIFSAIRKTKLKNASFYIASLACPLLNTLFFMTSLVVFFYPTDYIQTFATALGATNPVVFIFLFVGLQGAIEAVVCFIAASLISRILWSALKKG